ncbi:glycerophosphodiester phosphodiesterase [Acinetobacter sp. MB5]|uniref:glycerophosphodiester phosphodiesterase n=1 Tax=Acinetobacter sp. MB5 TaxID=2069438 RepID=UPI000DD0404E|nr:glycerophosphodiester phosphodiesterase [Acinetobacter sp. MB5]
MQIIGHRGARGEAPENTLGGFNYLRQLGIRAVEFDVRQLPDDTLIVIHDDNFFRTTGKLSSVYQNHQHDLVHYDHRFKWKNWLNPELTPLLSEALELLHDFKHIEVEVKAVAHQAEAEHLVETLQQELQGFEQSATITSFDEKILKALQKNQSPFQRGFLIEDNIKSQAIEKAIKYGCNRIGWKDKLATPDMIELSKLAGLAVSVWTVNEVKRAKELQDLGIDGLITDFPKTMQQQLQNLG